jgi:hypothetical protein
MSLKIKGTRRSALLTYSYCKSHQVNIEHHEFPFAVLLDILLAFSVESAFL